MPKYIMFSIVLIGLLTANFYRWHDPFWGVVLTLIYLLYFGQRLGAVALPDFNHFWQRLFGPLFLLAGWAVMGTAIYYFYAINLWVVGALLLIVPVGLIPYCHLCKKKIDKWQSGHLEDVPLVESNARLLNPGVWLLLLGDVYLFYYLLTHATAAAANSPWPILGQHFLIVFFLVTWGLVMFINRTKSSILSFFIIFAHALLLLSVALIVYKLGFGFDPFIHRAAEKYISEHGYILPKTPYYIGQYVLVIMLSKMTGLAVGLMDKILLPILEAVILPPLIFLMLRHGLQIERPAARLGSLLFFLLPFASFAATTPQDLANFFALTMILFGALFVTNRLVPWWIPLLLLLATLVTHPLIGLPMIGVFLLIIILSLRSGQALRSGASCDKGSKMTYIKIPLLIITSIIGAALLPLALIYFTGAEFGWPFWARLYNEWKPNWPSTRPDQPFSIIFTLIYYYQYLLPWLILIASGFGAYLLIKIKEKRPLVLLALLSFFIFLINIFALKYNLQLANIIDYEQTQYAGRLADFSRYLLLPLWLMAIVAGYNWLTRKMGAWRLGFGLLWLPAGVAGLLTISFYLSYPRVDAYAFSRSFNVSETDLKTAREIDKKAGGEDYVVLSNQIFSAAALQELGFKKYYKTLRGEIFYYALPTGGPLYDYYRRLVYQDTSRATVAEAMDLVGARQAFLVLHDYWNSFKSVAPQAKISADEWWAMDNGKILVFWYRR